MGGCQNYGPFLGPYYYKGVNTGPNLGTQKGTIILTIPHILREWKAWGIGFQGFDDHEATMEGSSWLIRMLYSSII